MLSPPSWRLTWWRIAGRSDAGPHASRNSGSPRGTSSTSIDLHATATPRAALCRRNHSRETSGEAFEVTLDPATVPGGHPHRTVTAGDKLRDPLGAHAHTCTFACRRAHASERNRVRRRLHRDDLFNRRTNNVRPAP